MRTHALGNARGVHRGVARADDDDVAVQAGLDLLFHLLHPLDHALHVALNVELAGLPRAGGHQDVRVAHLLELFDGRSRLAELDLDTVALHERDVLVDGLVADAEGGDDVARHAAELALALEDRGGNALAAEKVRRGDTGRAAADDGNLLVVNGLGHAERRHERAVALFRGKKLRLANVDGFLIEVARALALAAVRADGAGDKRQGVLLGDELQCRAVEPLAAELKIFGNVLLDGAAALAGRGKAVEQRHLFIFFARGERLDCLEVVEVVQRGGGKVGDRGGVVAGKCAVGHILDLFDHLVQAVVAAGLQDGGGDGDGPDAGGKELVTVEVVRAACERNAHLAAKLAGDAIAHLDRQREEAAAGHVHFLVGKLAARRIDGEGVGELETELEAVLVRELLQPFEHRHGVLPLEVFVEVMFIKDNVVIAHGIEDAARGFVAKNGRIALDEGVQMLFLEKIACDALDLLRRAAVERGERDGAGNIGGDRGDEVLFLGEELGQDFFTFLELRGLARVHHVVDIGVDLAALDAVQVVADGHIEHEPVRIAEAVDLAHDLERAPGLDVLVLRLLHGQFGRPLLVVALVSGEDTGAGNTGGKLRAVHYLHGLDLEKARAGGIGRDDILRKLAVGAGGGAKRCFDALAKDRQALAARVIVLMNAEHIAALRVFARHPVHQRVERNGIHFFRHYFFLPLA